MVFILFFIFFRREYIIKSPLEKEEKGGLEVIQGMHKLKKLFFAKKSPFATFPI